MKAQDLHAAANAAAQVENIAQFEVTGIGSITVQANLLLTEAKGVSVAYRCFPDDPNFAVLEKMLRDFAAGQKAAAQAAITAAGLTHSVDPALVDAAKADTARAKKQLDDIKARNAAKAALSAAQAAIAAGSDPVAAAAAAAKSGPALAAGPQQPPI